MALVALATLDVITDAAGRAPVVLIIDDAHLLDRPTRDALAFVARRVEHEPVAVIFAVREGAGTVLSDFGLPELELRALPEHDAAALLDLAAPDLQPDARRRILRESAGNPLALTELPSAIAAQGAQADLVPLTSRLERTFSARSLDLPSTTRALLLIAAADRSCAMADVLQAASVMVGAPVALNAVEPAIDAQLVTLEGERLGFRHPLVASAIYRTAKVTERVAAHPRARRGPRR